MPCAHPPILHIAFATVEVPLTGCACLARPLLWCLTDTLGPACWAGQQRGQSLPSAGAKPARAVRSPLVAWAPGHCVKAVVPCVATLQLAPPAVCSSLPA
eukprot:2778070-Amphidinium_carterae.1